MNLNDKYYTPKIEEFYVGFEYEIFEKRWAYPAKYISKNTFKLEDAEEVEEWFKKTFDGEYFFHVNHKRDIIDYLPDYIKDKKVRIKYLDKEDIESLGWIIEEEFSDGRIGASKTFFNERNQLTDKVNLLYAQNQKWCMIYIEQEDFEEQDITRFSGNIKNKSELKLLMSWLNITL